MKTRKNAQAMIIICLLEVTQRCCFDFIYVSVIEYIYFDQSKLFQIKYQLSNEKKIMSTNVLFSDDFLHTTVENAILSSPILQFYNKIICVQLLIGLCAECDAHVTLNDAVNGEILGMIIAKGSSNSAIHGLPMWQSVEIKTNSSVTNYTNGIIIQLIPKLNDKNSLNPLWAIANVRQCPQNGANFIIFIFLLNSELS